LSVCFPCHPSSKTSNATRSTIVRFRCHPFTLLVILRQQLTLCSIFGRLLGNLDTARSFRRSEQRSRVPDTEPRKHLHCEKFILGGRSVAARACDIEHITGFSRRCREEDHRTIICSVLLPDIKAAILTLAHVCSQSKKAASVYLAAEVQIEGSAALSLQDPHRQAGRGTPVPPIEIAIRHPVSLFHQKEDPSLPNDGARERSARTAPLPFSPLTSGEREWSSRTGVTREHAHLRQ
jgi:hypothetical protein